MTCARVCVCVRVYVQDDHAELCARLATEHEAAAVQAVKDHAALKDVLEKANTQLLADARTAYQTALTDAQVRTRQAP